MDGPWMSYMVIWQRPTCLKIYEGLPVLTKMPTYQLCLVSPQLYNAAVHTCSNSTDESIIWYLGDAGPAKSITICFISMKEYYYACRAIPNAVNGYQAHLNTNEAFNKPPINELMAATVDTFPSKGMFSSALVNPQRIISRQRIWFLSTEKSNEVGLTKRFCPADRQRYGV